MANRPLRIAFLADIHSNLPAYYAVRDKIQDLYGKNIDYTICLGDVIGYGPKPNELIKISETFDLTIIGNHDIACATGNADGFNPDAQKAVLWTFDELTTYNKTYISIIAQNEFKTIEERGVKIYLTHASPKDYLTDYIYPEDSIDRKNELLGMIGESHILIVGHTHIPLIYQNEEGKVIYNPGSVGQPRDNDPRASAGIMEIDTDSQIKLDWIRVKYDIREVARDIQKVGLPIHLAERLFFGN
ncbi:MAG: metallophosphoesterase family protein [Candidatus Hodarchaeales archaeon]|jgi:putative phosphoesterase